ncbi:hypothetical protein Brsp04_03270 [Brucella sp. NBRC 12952]|jgi:hypothetical protein|uniref:Putative membrane protein n=1 Tax=Brucella pseudogrignonensis TaxID=419475 RepID=A0A256G692_9HYPH|nr:putative membrane protein [Brucella pseudogrignonensis]
MLYFLIIEGIIIAALSYLVTMLAWKEIKYQRNHTRRLQS